MSCPACFQGSLDSGTPTGEETTVAGASIGVEDVWNRGRGPRAVNPRMETHSGFP